MTLPASHLTLLIPFILIGIVVSDGQYVADVRPRLGETFYGEIRELLRRRLHDIEVSRSRVITVKKTIRKRNSALEKLQ